MWQVPDIIDNAYAVVEYENGARAMLDLCMFAEGSKNEQEVSVVGDNGKVTLRAFHWQSCFIPSLFSSPESLLWIMSHIVSLFNDREKHLCQRTLCASVDVRMGELE